jgi:hypothetical protein
MALEIGGTQGPTQPYTLRSKILNFVKDYVNVKPKNATRIQEMKMEILIETRKDSKALG